MKEEKKTVKVVKKMVKKKVKKVKKRKRMKKTSHINENSFLTLNIKNKVILLFIYTNDYI